ncbi:GNAT family N-acetyltransferase [Pedobacter metabolipauper]|uniref:Acetyltransferase (GNAT) family protein n=1 Tax=Pedobacter metabolipauper TaxID=425513 RepID=A0A4R6SRW0_9SPHI|nr:GNAT family N-acetyltransferase [Pedobacter metabolipauper]TDQ06417.1 acetyltransferase (GNAT) family protein [Pedobacter metabolipauper]
MSAVKLDATKLSYEINPDLSRVDWKYVCELFDKVNWRVREEREIEAAFKKSTWSIFIYEGERLIAFGRTVDDGRYYALLADVVVDPDFQGNGLGKYLVKTLNEKLGDNYHFVNLTAAPGKGDFYKSLGWKKQSTSYIWPQGPKQLRQHTEPDQ